MTLEELKEDLAALLDEWHAAKKPDRTIFEALRRTQEKIRQPKEAR